MVGSSEYVTEPLVSITERDFPDQQSDYSNSQEDLCSGYFKFEIFVVCDIALHYWVFFAQHLKTMASSLRVSC